MDEEAHLISSIWERISDYISTGYKQDAANALVHAFLDVGIEIEELADAEGECPILDRALAERREPEDYLYDED